MNETVLQEARRLYELATHEWRRQRDCGGIVEETDERERLVGVRFKGSTAEGWFALGNWQKRKAELDAASKYAAYTPPTEYVRPAPRLPAPDPRLPPERDEPAEDAEAWNF